MTMMTPRHGVLPASLEERYASVKDRVARAALRSGRRAEDIILCAVTKQAEPEQIRTLLDLGHIDFGENRVQELAQRAVMVEEYFSRLRVHPQGRRPQVVSPLLPAATPEAGPGVRWHMIGHLQRNKARKVIEFVRLVQSVDSLRLAEELQQIGMKRDQAIDVLIQVNCSGELTKYGCPVPAAMPLAEQVSTMANVRVRGLMTIAPLAENPEDARPTFARCRDLFEEIKGSPINEGQFNILSMGMSGDFEVAIAEGANLVRVGTAIFGEARPAPG